MTWPPVCSEDVREERQAAAEAAAAASAEALAHRTVCAGGWLGEDAEGHPIPCLICRPHLRPPETP